MKYFIHLPMKMEPIVPKRRQLELRRRGITQKGIIYIDKDYFLYRNTIDAANRSFEVV